MRRNPYENRPGGKRHREQLDRIEQRLTWLSILVLVLVVLGLVYLFNHH